MSPYHTIIYALYTTVKWRFNVYGDHVHINNSSNNSNEDSMSLVIMCLLTTQQQFGRESSGKDDRINE